MLKFIYKILLIQFLLPVFFFTCAQIYKADYKNLSSRIFYGKTPTICILETDTSHLRLYDGLAKFEDFKKKFTCFPTKILKEYKDELKTDEFNPENKKFLNSLYRVLKIEYLLTWDPIPDSGGFFHLSIYSTRNYKKLYENEIMQTANSSPVLDVKKLLVDNSDPFYFIASGELVVNAIPENTHFSLFKGDQPVKEWTGKGKIEIEEGNYKLISEADDYLKDDREIEIQREQESVINIQLPRDLSLLPKIISGDNTKNINLKLEGEQLKISYDLKGETEDKYEINLFLIKKSSQINYKISAVTGDIGEDIFPGDNKNIVWNFLKDVGRYSNLINYDLQLSAEKKGGLAWYYYVGGAVVVGGATALLLSKKNSAAENSKTKIGEPPSRP